MKDLIIIRGISGSGKSTFASSISKAVCSNDDFHIRNGIYDWNPYLINEAYMWCERKCELFMKRGITPIAVANTFVKEAHLKSYYELAEKYGYRVFCIIIENRLGTNNVHNVPDEALKKQARKFKIKLV